MGYLPYPPSRTIFITGSKILNGGKNRNIVIESRPEFAIVRLEGAKEQYPLAWEAVYEAAEKHHKANLRLEEKAGKHRPEDIKKR
jgi:hypothetical protein